MNAIQQRAAMDLQNAEFTAANALATEWRRLQMTPIVDDDYPYIRSGYEGAVQAFLKACQANGRVMAPSAVGTVAPTIILDEVAEELERAKKFKPFNSAHEGYAVLLEEVDELKAHVWMNQTKRDLYSMRKEAIQVAAMAIKFVEMMDAGRGRV